MEIAGLIIRSRPENLKRIEKAIQTVAGSEIHHSDPAGKLVVTLEHDSHRELVSAISSIGDIDRLLSVSLVYQYSDEFSQEPEMQS